jgi:uncharacterized membrane protein YedE/YeeE
MSSTTLSSAPARNSGVIWLAGAALFIGALALVEIISLRMALLFLIGALMGASLFHASFGFTGGWRRLVEEKRGRTVRAQMLMVGIAALGFFPLLDAGQIFDRTLVGAIAPVGVSVVFGATIFGLGMQLGGGCGSGTLFTVGSGSTRMLVTLAFFIVGALAGTAHLPYWLGLPSFGPISLSAEFGWPVGLAITLVGLAAVAAIVTVLEKRKHGNVEKFERILPKKGELLSGPWPVVFAVLMLAVLNILTLIIAGHSWSITAGFGLWGAKIATAIGVPVAEWEFWTWPGQAASLNNSVLADTVSVMDFGVILGAALAASIAGKFAQKADMRIGSLIAAVLGGLLMGYGARLSFGCNIGALFSGIASGSVHGWVWMVCAFFGSFIGIKLRPLFFGK